MWNLITPALNRIRIHDILQSHPLGSKQFHSFSFFRIAISIRLIIRSIILFRHSLWDLYIGFWHAGIQFRLHWAIDCHLKKLSTCGREVSGPSLLSTKLALYLRVVA